MSTGTVPSTPNARRRRPWLAVGGLLALAGFFLAWEPLRKDALYRAASPHAEWISHHDRIGDRLDLLTSNAVVRTSLLSAGVSAEKMAKWRDRPSTRFWFEELLPDRALLVREPRMGALSTPGWVACSRVGSRHARLRMMADWIGLDGATRLGNHRGRNLWELENKGGERLVLALADGMVVACLHEDPDAIRGVLDRMDGLLPNLLDARPRVLGPWHASPESTDRGLWLGEGGPVAVSLGELDPQFLAVEAWGEALDAWTFSEEAPGGMRAFSARLAGPHAMVMARIPSDALASLPQGAEALLLGYPYFGKLSLFGIPTPILVAPAESREAAIRLADGLLRQAGRSYGVEWSRMDLPSPAGLWTYLPASPEFRRWIEARHAPAAGYWDGYLVLCGSHEVLQALRSRWDRPESTFEMRGLAWNQTQTLLWIDPPRLSTQLEPLLRMWGFQASAQRRDPSEVQADVERWNQAIAEWKRLPVARVRNLTLHGIPRVRIEMGAETPAESSTAP